MVSGEGSNGRSKFEQRSNLVHPISRRVSSKTTEKIRVVFDCPVNYKAECLNKHLLQGPDLTNNLVGVCDIEAMFHQFKVNIEHRNFLRFLWWGDGGFDRSPEDYRMTVHLFGAVSSPGCANFGLKTNSR